MQLFADGGGRNVALNEAGRRQPVPLVVSENEDPVLLDCAAKRPSELIESEMGLDGDGLEARVDGAVLVILKNRRRARRWFPISTPG